MSRPRDHYCAIIPLFAAFIWCGTLLAMILTWAISGRPKYVPAQVAVPYISDIGASFLKPLFVVACCITGPGLVLSLTIERFMRHAGRLLPELRTRERIFGFLSILSACIAMIGLAFLSGFDCLHYPTEHDSFLLIFMIGVVLSAIFTVSEFRWLSEDYPAVRRLKRSYTVKAILATILILLSIVFAGTFATAENVGGVVEWVIGFGFTFYLLTFAYDLWWVKTVDQDHDDRLVAEKAGP